MAVKRLKTTSSPRIVKTNIPGAPGFSQDKQKFKRFIPHPIQNRLSIKTVIKNNPADGLTQPEASSLGGTAGVSTPGAGGYKGMTIMHQQPQVPPTTKTNTKTFAPPSATNKGGIRNPFNLARRTGGRGKV